MPHASPSPGLSRRAGEGCGEPSPRHGLVHPGGARKADRQSRGDTCREEPEALRLQRVAVPADCLHRLDRHAQHGAQRGHDRRIVPAAAGDQPAQRGRRQRSQRHGLGGERHQRCRAIGGGQRIQPAGGQGGGKVQPVQRLRRRPWRNTGAASNRPSTVRSTCPVRARAPSRSKRSPVWRATQSSSGPLPGPVSNATNCYPPAQPRRTALHLLVPDQSRSRWPRRRGSTPPAASADPAPAPHGRPGPAAPLALPLPRLPTGNPTPPAPRCARRVPPRCRSARSADAPAGAGWSGRGSRSGRRRVPARRRPARGIRSAAPRPFSAAGRPGPASAPGPGCGAGRRAGGHRRATSGSGRTRRCARHRSPARPRPRHPAMSRSSARSSAAFAPRLSAGIDAPSPCGRGLGEGVRATSTPPPPTPSHKGRGSLRFPRPDPRPNSSAPTMSTSDFLAEATARGFVHQCTDTEALGAALNAPASVTAYIGFDCTADSLHVGSLVQIMILRLLQKHGHRPLVLMGGGTTRIGDPSGKDEVAPVADRRADRRQHGRHPPLLHPVPALRRWAVRRASWPTMPTGWTRWATSRCCARSACTSPSTAC